MNDMQDANFEISFSDLASQDLHEIIDYYLDKAPDYATNLFDDIKTQVNLLATHPNMGRTVPELATQHIYSYRELIVGHYRVIYAQKSHTIIIHTIIDSRRNVADLLVEKLLR